MNQLNPDITVVICTYNPKRDYLTRVLNALKSQTLPFEYWELLLVDNASEDVLFSEIDLSWHLHARHIREDKLGKTYALINSFKQAKGNILIIVDDDNVLDKDYVEVALKISKEYTFLGAWGGQSRPEFEQTPPDWTKPYWPMLAIGEFGTDRWSNLVNQHLTTPWGAGMCIRKVVAEQYINATIKEPRRITLGRKGNSLTSGEDSDIAFTACDIGLGMGRLAALKLTHLIPAKRFEEEYLLKLREAMSYSHLLMESFRHPNLKLPIPSWKRTVFQWSQMLWMNARERRFYKAEIRGKNRAVKEIILYKVNS